MGLALLLSIAAVPQFPWAPAPPDPAMPRRAVPDTALARMRGGVQLPNGLTLSLGIDIQTRVDGVLVLHSIYNSDGPAAGVRVFTDGADSPRTAPGTITVVTAQDPAIPALIVARAPAGTTIQAGKAMPGTTVNLVSGGPATWANAAGQTEVPVVANGPAIAAAPGLISVQGAPSGVVVTLDAPMLQVRQLIGQATGVVVANTGNNRAIDTVTAVNVDLQGLSPTLMNSLFAIQRAVADARAR